jgi:hypothetical protein
MKRIRIPFLWLMMVSLLFASCANKHPKKCNGKRGTKVPMGVI